LIVGTVFLSEGIQKFLFPAFKDADLLAKSGLPTLIIMLVAIVTTKSSVLINDKFREMIYGSRTD
tara:strand:- start:167 stop:361 length:195 start_codon:yes stop_codon:yes gene_type:complete